MFIKSEIVAFVLVLFIFAIGAIGFLDLNYMNHSGQHICPISLLSGGNCSLVNGSIALAVHHVSVLQNFTQSMSNFDYLVLALYALLIFLPLLIVFKILQSILTLHILFRNIYDRHIELIYISRSRFLRWLVNLYKLNPHVI